MRHAHIRWRARGGRGPRELLPIGLAAAGAFVGWRLLHGTYAMFQHAYLGTYWAVPGGQVASTYWASVRFAFQETVLVAAGVGVLASLAVVEVGRAASR